MGSPLILPAPGPDWNHHDEARRNFAIKNLMDRKLERADVEVIFREALTTAPEYADDGEAATGGLPVGGLYRSGSTLKVRVA